MKVLLYVRVSTDAQVQHGHSIEAQLEALYEYVEAKGLEVAGEFIDRGLSGRTQDREEFLAMINYATTPLSGISAVLVHKFDRFSRSREDAILYKALLKKHGVSVISISEPLEDTPAGALVEGILETIAEFYSKNLSLEVKKGQFQAAKKGLNQSEAPLGYCSNNGVLTINHNEALIVRFIYANYLKNHSYRKVASNIATEFNKNLHPSSIAYILRNEAYIGIRIWNKRRHDGTFRSESEWIKVYNSHDPIISEEDFFKVRSLLEKRSLKKNNHLFSGLCRCSLCNKTLHCHSQRGKVRLTCPTKGCKGVSILETNLEKIVFDNISHLLFHCVPKKTFHLDKIISKEYRQLILRSTIDHILIAKNTIDIVYRPR